jgi:arginine-tRNA-protein transferase
MERKLFTALHGEQAEAMNDSLSRQGFRRSQNVLYRPSCAECSACLSARIRVADFKPSRSQRRVLKRNAHLRREVTSAWATEDQYALFRRYLDHRHAQGGMADMDVFEYSAMVEESPVRTRLLEYCDRAVGPMGQLSAVCLSDVLEDGLSLVYSFFDPDLSAQSLGSYMILDQVELARKVGLPYVYLGYWVPGSPKMDYKARFAALEIYHQGKWQDLDDPRRFSGTTHPLSVQPIAEQVADLELPSAVSAPVSMAGRGRGR